MSIVNGGNCKLPLRIIIFAVTIDSNRRFPRLYRRGPKLITIFDRPALQDLALTPVLTDGELPLD
jgi:hypothetical protein